MFPCFRVSVAELFPSACILIKMLAASHYPVATITIIEPMSNNEGASSGGFSLVEALMAILILTFGFMFVGEVMVGSIGSSTLSRSKGTAGVAATNKLEALALKYRANPNDSELTVGSHGPEQVEIVNPQENNKINRFNVGWTVSSISDPSSGAALNAVQVTITVTPIGAGTAVNNKVGLNKVLSVSTIFSFNYRSS
jgi:type II secretory pathway pseudopilin PulG